MCNVLCGCVAHACDYVYGYVCLYVLCAEARGRYLITFSDVHSLSYCLETRFLTESEAGHFGILGRLFNELLGSEFLYLSVLVSQVLTATPHFLTWVLGILNSGSCACISSAFTH